MVEIATASPAGMPSFAYLTTDAQVLGILSWVSLTVTVAGFWIAIAQLRKTRSAAEAAARAGQQTEAVTRRREQGAKLGAAIAQLKMSSLLLQREEALAAGAYLESACGLLVDTKELSGGDDQTVISERLLSLRQLIDVIHSGKAMQPGVSRRKGGAQDLRTAISGLEEMAARLRYAFDVGNS